MPQPGETTPFEWSRLRRRPDTEAPNLFASDAADRLIVDTAAFALAESAPDEVAVIGDTYGAMTLAAATLCRKRQECDVRDGESAFSALSSSAPSASPASSASSATGAVPATDATEAAAIATEATTATPEAGRPVATDAPRAVGIRVHQDSVIGERALAANALSFGETVPPKDGPESRRGAEDGYRSLALGAALVEGARVVLLRLPKSLDALDEVAASVAAGASDDVVVVAGGMQKHLSVAMNEVLGRYFERVDVGLGRQKARTLTVRGPRREAAVAALAAWPRREFHDGIVPQGVAASARAADSAPASTSAQAVSPASGLWVCAHGGAFAGTRVDIGTRLLLSHLAEAAPAATAAVDLACGTGVLAAALALSRPRMQVVATDVSAAAVASAQATAAANGVDDPVRTRRESAGEGIAAGWADLVVLNPPFHTAAAVDLRIGRMLVAAAARLLAPGGELWTVFNSHLDYRPVLSREVGPTRQVDRNAKFTVTASVRR